MLDLSGAKDGTEDSLNLLDAKFEEDGELCNLPVSAEMPCPAVHVCDDFWTSPVMSVITKEISHFPQAIIVGDGLSSYLRPRPARPRR